MAQPPQHLLLKEVSGQGPDHGAERRRCGVVLRHGRHRILKEESVTGCCGDAWVGDGGDGSSDSRSAREVVCGRDLLSFPALPFALGNPTLLPYSYSAVPSKEGASRSRFTRSPRSSSDLVGGREVVREGSGGAGGGGDGGRGSRADDNLWRSPRAFVAGHPRSPRQTLRAGRLYRSQS